VKNGGSVHSQEPNVGGSLPKEEKQKGGFFKVTFWELWGTEARRRLSEGTRDVGGGGGGDARVKLGNGTGPRDGSVFLGKGGGEQKTKEGYSGNIERNGDEKRNIVRNYAKCRRGRSGLFS